MICWFSILPLDLLKSRVQTGEEEKNCHISLYYKCFLLVCIVTRLQELASPNHARITFLLFFARCDFRVFISGSVALIFVSVPRLGAKSLGY